MLAGAAPRYLHTHLTKSACLIFHGEDSPLLNYLTEDGRAIEPTFFVPVVPMVLLNGASGIGTGFSTYVPNYSLGDVIGNLRAMLRGEEPQPMMPSWSGFKGSVELDDKDLVVKGLWEAVGKERVRVTELPIGTSIDAYKAFLESDKANAKSIENNCTDETVDFTIEFAPERLEEILRDPEKELGLRKRISVANMHLFDARGHIRRFECAADILREFFRVRLDLYERRRLHLIKAKEDELAACTYRALFISAVLSGRVRLLNVKRAEVRDGMQAIGVPEECCDRLLGLPLSALTAEEVERLQAVERKLTMELEALKKKDASGMWEEDLAAIERLATSS